jgi:hypothetical protein
VIGVVLAAQLTGRGLPALTESAPRSSLPFWVVTLGWIPFSVGLTLLQRADERAPPWVTALVLGTFLLQRGADAIAGELFSTLIHRRILRADRRRTWTAGPGGADRRQQ